MGQKKNTANKAELIEELFYTNPSKRFHIREISRLLKIPKTTVSYKINKLLKEKIIIKSNEDVFPSFHANYDSEIYRFNKKIHALRKIHDSCIVEYLEQECRPGCIVLFGSYAKGEYDSDSDIDIFVEAEKTDISLGKYSEFFGKEINIIWASKINSLGMNLLNNIVNGIKLKGNLRVFKDDELGRLYEKLRKNS